MCVCVGGGGCVPDICPSLPPQCRYYNLAASPDFKNKQHSKTDRFSGEPEKHGGIPGFPGIGGWLSDPLLLRVGEALTVWQQTIYSTVIIKQM